MVYIVAASSLHHSLKDLESEKRKVYSTIVTTIPGLSLNPNTKVGKNLQFRLDEGHLHSRKDLVVWHDIINISISSPSSNNYRPGSPENIGNYLNQGENVL